MSTSNASTERKKLLTRARGILLDNGIYSVDALVNTDLAAIPNVGPKMIDLINEVVGSTNVNDIVYLFPYPEGPDDACFSLADEADTDEVPDGPSPAVPTEALTRALHGLRQYGYSWTDGYLSALIDSAEGVAGFAEIAVQEMQQIIYPPARTEPLIRGAGADAPRAMSEEAYHSHTATQAVNGVARMNGETPKFEGC